MKNVMDDARVKQATRELEKIQKNIEAKKKELAAHNERTFAGSGGIGGIIYRFPEDKKKAETLLDEIRALEKEAGNAEGAVAVAVEGVANEYREKGQPIFAAALCEADKLRLDFHNALKKVDAIIRDYTNAGVSVASPPLLNFGRGSIGNSLELLENQNLTNRRL